MAHPVHRLVPANLPNSAAGVFKNCLASTPLFTPGHHSSINRVFVALKAVAVYEIKPIVPSGAEWPLWVVGLGTSTLRYSSGPHGWGTSSITNASPSAGNRWCSRYGADAPQRIDKRRLYGLFSSIVMEYCDHQTNRDWYFARMLDFGCCGARDGRLLRGIAQASLQGLLRPSALPP